MPFFLLKHIAKPQRHSKGSDIAEEQKHRLPGPARDRPVTGEEVVLQGHTCHVTRAAPGQSGRTGASQQDGRKRSVPNSFPMTRRGFISYGLSELLFHGPPGVTYSLLAHTDPVFPLCSSQRWAGVKEKAPRGGSEPGTAQCQKSGDHRSLPLRGTGGKAERGEDREAGPAMPREGTAARSCQCDGEAEQQGCRRPGWWGRTPVGADKWAPGDGRAGAQVRGHRCRGRGTSVTGADHSVMQRGNQGKQRTGHETHFPSGRPVW